MNALTRLDRAADLYTGTCTRLPDAGVLQSPVCDVIGIVPNATTTLTKNCQGGSGTWDDPYVSHPNVAGTSEFQVGLRKVGARIWLAARPVFNIAISVRAKPWLFALSPGLSPKRVGV